MVVVVGREGRVIAKILQALADENVRAHGGVTQDPADLFGLVTELGCRAVVGVGPLTWWGDPASGATDLELLDQCLAAAQSPVRPRLVWVSSQGPLDEEAKRIRRSGIPYFVVRAAPLVPLASQELATAIEGHEVLVPADLHAPAGGVATPGELAQAVVRAVVADDVGRTIEVGHTGDLAWCEVVESLGGRPRSVGAFRARAGRLMGQPVLELHQDGLRVRGLRSRPDFRAEPAPALGSHHDFGAGKEEAS